MELGGDRLLEMLPPLLGFRKNLKELWLFDCPELKCLPNSFVLLTQLIELTIERCLELQCLPDSFGQLTQLIELTIDGCPEFKCLPDSFGQLTQLAELKIRNCGVEYLPQDLLKMNNLEILEVWGCPLRELPFKRIEGERETAFLLNKLDSPNDNCMFGLKKLTLWATNISELCFPQGVCPSLQSLVVLSCKELRQIEGLGGLATLQRLDIESCHKIEELHVGGLATLQRLYVGYCREIEEVRGVEHVMSLETVMVPGCPKLQWEGGVVEQLRQRLKDGFWWSEG